MSTEIKGSLVLNTISTDAGVTKKTIICETDSTITGSSSVTETKTKTCGTKISVSNDAVKVSGNGLAMGDQGATEVSYMDLQKLRDAGTLISFERTHAVTGTLTAGEVSYCAFSGYVTSVSETSNSDGLSTFTWEITSSGTIDWIP